MTKKRGPFRFIHSREIYKNPWIRVREDKVIRPDGKRGIFGIVEALPGISVIPIDEKGYCYFTKEYHYAVGKVTIEAVSGGMDKGETPLETAKRELLEEGGLKSTRWIYLGCFYPFTTILYSPQYIFLALDAKKVVSPIEEDKRMIRIIRVPFRKSIEMVLKSQITHAGTAIALLKTDYYLQKKKYDFRKSRH